MAKVRVRPETGNLYLDFSFRGIRCKEYTALTDAPANRRTVEALASRIKREIAKGTFNYRTFFPDSPRASQFEINLAAAVVEPPTNLATTKPNAAVPTLAEFAEEWFKENKPRWRTTHANTTRRTLDLHIIPKLGEQSVASITRADLLSFRSELGTATKKKGGTLSPSRINHIMTPLRMVLTDAAERYEFISPFRNIKPLRLPKVDIDPFSLEEVNRILETVRKDWHPYLVTRFFTGMRTGEVNGLEWKHIDFDKDLILVRQQIVEGEIVDTKTVGSTREIPMVPQVRAALLEQRKLVPEECRWVFAQRNGEPISLVNFTNRIWKPLLRHLGLKARRPYQTRHTAATLMLGAGENPEWVARVLGHSSTEMLFRVYSRYVPNLTRNDGRAFMGLVNGGTDAADAKLPASLETLTRNQLEALLRRFEQQVLAKENNHAQ